MKNFNRIWSRRAEAFWKEAAVYWSYAARSGLTAFTLLLVIIGGYVYMRILKTLPETYPYWRMTTPFIAAALGWCPYRTFLKPADEVFLMPGESKLRGYWLRSAVYSFVFQALALTAALLLIWPLYRHCEGTEAIPFLEALAALLAAKAMCLGLRVQESRLTSGRHRVLTGMLRWIGAIVFAFSLMTQSFTEAALLFLVFIVLAGGTSRLLPKHRIPWDYWIRKEAEQLKAHYSFFSWFADVPKLQVKPKPRMGLARFAGSLRFGKGEAYRYLYALTLLRSEWFRIVARILVIAVLLFVSVENAVAEPLIYGFALLMSAATVSSLDQSHRYSFWLELYPLRKSDRPKAIVSTARWALLPMNGIMGTALFLFHSSRLNALLAFAAGCLYILYYTSVPLRRRASRRED